MACPHCKVVVRDIRQHTRALADKTVLPCCTAANNACRVCRQLRIRLLDGRAFDMCANRISSPSDKAGRSEVPQTNTAGSSGPLCRKYSAFQPRTGISDIPHHLGGIGAQPEGDCTSFEAECTETYTEEVGCHMVGEGIAACDRRRRRFPQRSPRGTSCNCLDGTVAHKSVFDTPGDARTS